MQILSLQVGKPKSVRFAGKDYLTGIFKEKTKGPLRLNFLNLEGDGQADLRVHGGPDKALYVYGSEAYAGWKKLRPDDQFPGGAMGENLTLTELSENQIHVGDIFSLGTATIQAIQPRLPCNKLGIKFNDMKIIKQFMNFGRPGVYFRVLSEGMISEGDVLKEVKRNPLKVSIIELLQIQKGFVPEAGRIKEMLALEVLPQFWRSQLSLLGE